MAASTVVCILTFYFALQTVDGYICFNQRQFHSLFNVDCAYSISCSNCKFRQGDDLIYKGHNDHVNPAVILKKRTYDYGDRDAYVSNGINAKWSGTGSSSESKIDQNSKLNVDLQNTRQVNLDASSTIPELVTDTIVSDGCLIADDDDMSENETNTDLSQSNATPIPNIGKDIKEQDKREKPPVNYQSTNELNRSKDVDSSVRISDTSTELNHSESKETPWIILNNQQTIVLVADSLDINSPYEYSERFEGIILNSQDLNLQMSPNNGVIYGNIVNLNSGTTSYTLVYPDTLYRLNSVPGYYVQTPNRGYHGVSNTVQSYYTIQFSDGQLLLVPNNHGQSLVGNGLVKLVPLNNLHASLVGMQNIPAIRKIQVPRYVQDMNAPRVFQGPLYNQF